MSDYLRGIFNLKRKEQRRREMRKDGAAPEAVLWKYLQRRQLLGKKFRRQHGIGPYIVDFYCPECRVIVELDGAPHFEPGVEEYETARTTYLENLGMKILRFENGLLWENPEIVLDAIKRELEP